MSTYNPYQSPFGELRTPVYAPSMPPADGGLPVLTMVVAIIDLIFCVLRAFLVAFGILGYMVLKQQGQTELATSAIFEVQTGGAMVIFGLPATGSCWRKKAPELPSVGC